MKISIEEVEVVDVGGGKVGMTFSKFFILFIISTSFSLIIGSFALVFANLFLAFFQEIVLDVEV